MFYVTNQLADAMFANPNVEGGKTVILRERVKWNFGDYLPECDGRPDAEWVGPHPSRKAHKFLRNRMAFCTLVRPSTSKVSKKQTHLPIQPLRQGERLILLDRKCRKICAIYTVVGPSDHR